MLYKHFMRTERATVAQADDFLFCCGFEQVQNQLISHDIIYFINRILELLFDHISDTINEIKYPVLLSIGSDRLFDRFGK